MRGRIPVQARLQHFTVDMNLDAIPVQRNDNVLCGCGTIGGPGRPRAQQASGCKCGNKMTLLAMIPLAELPDHCGKPVVPPLLSG